MPILAATDKAARRGPERPAVNRVALYLGGSNSRAGLIRCASQARAAGERVVTVASEHPGGDARSRRPALGRLRQRMQAGEFEMIRASLEADSVVLIAPPGRD